MGPNKFSSIKTARRPIPSIPRPRKIFPRALIGQDAPAISFSFIPAPKAKIETTMSGKTLHANSQSSCIFSSLSNPQVLGHF